MPQDIKSLPPLASDYPISAAQQEAYQHDGHISVKGLASREEINAFRPVIVTAVEKHNRESRPMAERDTYGKAFLQTTNLWQKDPASAQFTMAHRFAKVAADLMGVESVRLFHDQALFKEAGGGITPWHQDQFYWPLDSERCITMWMPLVDCSDQMGTMRFASGSDKEGYLGNFAISDTSDQVFLDLIKAKNFKLSGGLPMHAGDATFHSGWVLHAASPNTTPTRREAMTVIYFADKTRASFPKNENQVGDLATWLPGVKPGQFAETPINPVLYKKE
jgi:ectoine hydroxylase-related dioxygenase (phytanoyl-CoA dioxygenase family)